ncbi:MAG TPA: oxidoreductase [Candidatus Dormibacteraeota bacterium]|nr:oxidoreductase [Candidatus Dormibacteraeota bacterium]
MSQSVNLGGVFTPAGTSLALNRVGYGAIQLAGQMAWGPPRDREAALAVVREAVRLGINHIDTSDYYGPHIANEIIREALHPYPKELVIVTKVGTRRGPDKSWPAALSKKELTDAVHDNLRHLGLDALDVVNLRVGNPFGPSEASIAEPLNVLAELQAKGLIKHVGLSNISRRQFAQGRAIAKIVCVQNHYNLAFRKDDALIDELSREGIAFVPFFPLGGFKPLRSPILDQAAASVGATTRQVSLAWLLQRSPNILIIAGTSSVEHLHGNLRAATMLLPPETVAQLNEVAATLRIHSTR